MSEAVEILLSVDDQASAAVSKAAQKVSSVDRDASKATPKLISMEKAGRTAGDAVGRIGDVLDVAELNRASGAFGSIAEQLELAKDSANGLKLGFIGTAGVIGGVAAGAFSIGKALGDIVYQTSAWEMKLESALSIAKQLEGRRSRGADRAFSDDLAFMELRGAGDEDYLSKIRQIKTEAEGVSRSLNAELTKIDALAGTAYNALFPYEMKVLQDSANTLQAQLEQLKEQEVTIQRILTVERDLSAERALKSRIDGEDRYIKQLREELELLSASAEEQDRIIAFRNAATIDGQAEIELLLGAKRAAESEIAKAIEKTQRVKANIKPRTIEKPTNLDGFGSRLLTRGPAQESQETKALKDILREMKEQKKLQEKTTQDISMLIRNPLVIGAPRGKR